MAFKYSQAYEKESKARAIGIALPISFKKSVEVCNMIRGMDLDKGVAVLENVIKEKSAVPFKRFAKGGTGHKKGIGPGRYPVKTCIEILKILNSARANAEQKGLSNLVIKNIVTQQAPKAWHYGRLGRREQKRAHVEVLLDSKKHVKKEKSEVKK